MDISNVVGLLMKFFGSKSNGNRWEGAQNIRFIHDFFVELFDRHVINVSTNFSVTGSDKDVKFL
jgi:hypothetical protein